MTADPTVAVRIHQPAVRSRTVAGMSVLVAPLFLFVLSIEGISRLASGDWIGWADLSYPPLWLAMAPKAAIVFGLCLFVASQLFRMDIEVVKDEGDLVFTVKQWFILPRTARVRSERLHGAAWEVRHFKRDASNPEFRPGFQPRVRLMRSGSMLAAVGIGMTVDEGREAVAALERLMLGSGASPAPVEQAHRADAVS